MIFLITFAFFFNELKITLNLIIKNEKIFIIIKSFNALNDLNLKIKIIIKIKRKIAKVFNGIKTTKIFNKTNVNLGL